VARHYRQEEKKVQPQRPTQQLPPLASLPLLTASTTPTLAVPAATTAATPALATTSATTATASALAAVPAFAATPSATATRIVTEEASVAAILASLK
jgi:hypothetical protein